MGIALLTALAGSVGGILLFDVSDFAEKALNSEAASISKVPLGDNTKLTLQAALVLLGFVVVAVGEPWRYACCCQLQSPDVACATALILAAWVSGGQAESMVPRAIRTCTRRDYVNVTS